MRALRSLAMASLLAACATSPTPTLRAELGRLCDPRALGDLAQGDAGLIVLDVRDEVRDEELAAAAAQVRAAGRRLGYWLEVGRSEALAAAHPEWLATLQGHDEWRRVHHEADTPAADQVVVAWPWVPVGYRQAFAAHRERIARRLAALPSPDLVFLNDLQGPPSACGCGNVLCRWATDYTLHGAKPRRSATPLGPDAAARFVTEVAAMVPTAEVVPVWVTECELEDTVGDGACHGVGCYHGACWKEFDRQWTPLRAAANTTALLLPYRAFGRDLERFGEEAGWVRFAIEHLRQRDRELPATALIAVLQGWGDADVDAQLAAAAAAGVQRVLVAEREIEQGLTPRLRRQAPE